MAIDRPLAARLVGRAARETLRPGGRLRVLAVFERSFYVERLPLSPGEPQCLACIGSRRLGAGALNALCDVPDDMAWPAAGLRAGMDIEIVAAEAALWTPPRPSAIDGDRIIRGLAALAEAVEGRDFPDGFGPLVAPLARGGELRGAGVLLAIAVPGIETLRRWLSAGGDSPVPRDLLALVGLGPGLTPSGDDLFGGALIALRLLGRDGAAASLAAFLQEHGTERTSAISRAHLRCAAEGEGAAVFHDVLASLLSGTAPPLAPLASLGHGSGWDMLAGATLAARASAAPA